MQLRVLYRFKKSIFSHSSVMKDIRLRTMACSASAKRSGNKTDLRSSSSVMAMSANKATRFVYLRTLPLVKQPELADEVDDIAKRIEACTKMLCEKHIDSVVDDRAAVHLHTASLAIATHRVLSAQIANEIRLTNIIRAGFGAALVPQTVGNDETIARQKASEKLRPDYWIIRAALWFSLDKMKSVRKMTANMVRDFGASFETSSRDTDTESQTEHKLIVRRCYYNTLCRQEGLPHLTKVFCALDRAIYSPITVASHGIEFALDKTLADNQTAEEANSTCEFKFTKRQ